MTKMKMIMPISICGHVYSKDVNVLLIKLSQHYL